MPFNYMDRNKVENHPSNTGRVVRLDNLISNDEDYGGTYQPNMGLNERESHEPFNSNPYNNGSNRPLQKVFFIASLLIVFGILGKERTN